MERVVFFPELTMPALEADELRRVYGGAKTIVEYGSGGSTVLAGQIPGGRVLAVESDAKWAGGMQAWFTDNPPAAQVEVVYANIGPTRRWGFPTNNRFINRWPAYVLAPWDRPDAVMPDVILIDGRFRVACFLTAMIRASAPVTVLWDDYGDRPEYHVVEKFARPVSMAGRMATFEITPGPFPTADLALLADSFMTPT